MADNHYKFADLQFADWHTSENYGFAIAEKAQEFSDWRVCGLNKKICVPTSVPDPDPIPEHLIHMFLGLMDPDPEPLVRGMDPDPDRLRLRILLSLSKNSKENLNFYSFVTSF